MTIIDTNSQSNDVQAQQVSKKTQIDPTLCIGCGTCVSLCPKYYQMVDNDSRAEVQPHHSIEPEEALEETITTCPVGAISWIKEPSIPSTQS